MNRLKKLLLSIFLSLTLVISWPVSVLAIDASPAPEAQKAPDAQKVPGDAQKVPDASPASEASPAPDASLAVLLSPSPSPSPWAENSSQNPETTVVDDKHHRNRDEGDDGWVPPAWSGNSSGSGNVGDTKITTGDAQNSGTVVNNANSSVVTNGGGDCSVCAPGAGGSVTNSGNGAGSNNSGSVSTNSDSSAVVTNNANLDNTLGLNSDSGHNAASYNVGDSSVTTGDANVSAVVINSANETGLGAVEYNIVGNQTGDVILAAPKGLGGSCGTCPTGGNATASNTGNGAESTNSATINSNSTSNTTITNNGNVTNNLNLSADSGSNDASFNTGGNSKITTGDANVAANLVNLVNSTIAGGVAFVVNVFGNLVGDIIFPDFVPGGGVTGVNAANVGNGAGSTNNAQITSNNTTNQTINNLADIQNNLNIDATTGGNLTSYNTGGDNSIQTGDVKVKADVLNVANVNLGPSSEPLWLILVNNMGTWTGKIIGAVTGTNFSGSEGLTFNVGAGGAVSATNSGNGADSTNTAAISSNNTNNLTINNDAKVVNNINISANTGKNSASYNTGGDSKISTGDVNVAASIVNFINTNLVGRTVMLGIINVFGSWTGNAVPPGHDPESKSSNSSVGGTSGAGGNGASSSSQGGGGGTGSTNVTLTIGGTVNVNGQQHNLAGILGSNGSSGGQILGSNQSITIENSGPTPAITKSDTKDSGLFSFTFNWKLLLLGLLPILGYALFRTRELINLKKQDEAAIALEIKVKKNK